MLWFSYSQANIQYVMSYTFLQMCVSASLFLMHWQRNIFKIVCTKLQIVVSFLDIFTHLTELDLYKHAFNNWGISNIENIMYIRRIAYI